MKRDLNTFPLDLGSELIVDNFAGGGGASTGLELAFGRPVDVAINHDPEALAMHAANHPHTAHYCESVFDVDPIAITGNQPVALVWLSPDCKHFSKAKGGKPVSKKIRGLAWIALRWAAKVKPRAIMLENVEVRRLLRQYVKFWRMQGRAHGWPNRPVLTAAKSPLELVRKFRKDAEYRTHRQRNWAASIEKMKRAAHKAEVERSGGDA